MSEPARPAPREMTSVERNCCAPPAGYPNELLPADRPEHVVACHIPTEERRTIWRDEITPRLS